MSFENFPLGPDMFDRAFGKTWGPRLWRTTFVAVLLAIFGGVLYGAWTVAKAVISDLGALPNVTFDLRFWGVLGVALVVLILATVGGLWLTRGAKNRLIERDIWLQDAVCFVMYGHWPAEDEQVFDKEGDIDAAFRVAQRMRELAGAGKLFIWGKSHELRLFELLPIDFWMDNQIEGLRLIGNPANSVPTENIFDGRRTDKTYTNLMVNKAQVEAVVDQLKPH